MPLDIWIVYLLIETSTQTFDFPFDTCDLYSTNGINDDAIKTSCNNNIYFGLKNIIMLNMVKYTFEKYIS